MNLYFLLLLFMVSTMVKAQNHYFFSRFTANDGLPSTKTYFTFQDSRGYIWISTNSGLSKYDGQKFHNYNLMDGLRANMIFFIAEDSSNKIWISTDNGQNVFDGKKIIDLEGYEHAARGIEFLGDTAFLATTHGLMKYFKTTLLDTLPLDNNVADLRLSTLYKSGNRIYVGTNRGIYMYENGKVFAYWIPDRPKYILSIAEDKKGNIWFCTLEGDVYYSKDNIFRKLSHPEEGNHNTFKIKLNQEGDIMLVHGQYISVYRNEKLHYYIDRFIEDPENVVTDVMEDREGNLWITTIYGVIVGRKTQIKKITFPRKSITYLFKSEYGNEVYAVGYKNIYKLKNDTVQEEAFMDKPDQMGELQFMTEYKPGCFLFASTLGGIVQYKNGKYKTLTKGFTMMGSFLKKGEDVWLSSKREVYKLSNDTLISYDFNELDKSPFIFLDLEELNEKENLVTTSKGIVKFSEEDQTLITLPYTGKNHPLLKKIIKENDSTFYIATKGHGLLNVSLTGDSATVNFMVNSKNSIINDDVIDFIIDTNKNFWLSTSSGLFKIYNINTPLQYVEHFGVEDGIPPHSWSFSCLMNDKRGNIYLSGSEGIAKFPMNLNSQAPVVQTTHLTAININGDKFQWELNDSLVGFEGVPSSYNFDYLQNAVTFHFAGMNFYKPQKVIYQYILEGMENTWTISSNSFASYNNLRPGTYNFKVRSGTNVLNVNKEPITSFAFTIAPPYWQTWWFKLLIGLGLASLIYSFYRYRLNEQFKKQQIQLEVDKQLNESKMMAFQARMNPHFVFNSLNSIQFFITNNDKVSTLTYLSKFAKLLRQIVDNSVQAKLSLDMEIEMLESYIEMEELRFDKRFSFKIHVDEELEPSNIEIPGMILQPFVENAILHGLLHKKEEEGKLKITFSKGKDQIICEIEDNGIGRAKSEELKKMKHQNHQSQGTRIAINRLEMLSNKEKDLINTVEFVDLMRNNKPVGTLVILKIPIL